eukprot:Em0021g652a
MATRSSEVEISTVRNKCKGGHKIGYCSLWKEDYPWLVPTEDTAGIVTGLLCEICKCQESRSSGIWTTVPCTSLRKDCIERHKKSKVHLSAASKIAVTQSTEGPLVHREALIGALKIVYWLAKEDIAITTKYESLVNLVKSLGCSYLNDLSIGRNATYTSKRIVAELLQCLSSVIESEKLDNLKCSPFFSLMTDESTDISVLKQLVIVAKYILPSGKIETSFLHIGDIADGTAETIEGAIVAFMETNGLDINKLRSFGSDGCAVMVGRVSGVASRLKVRQPRLVSVHCINHRLALAAAHAADNIPYLKRFKETVQSLFLFYHNSAVRMAGLHAIQEILNDPIIKLKQAKHVRWLSYDAAIGSVLRTLPSIIVSLECEGTEQMDAFIQHELKDHTIKVSATDRTSFTAMMQTKFVDAIIEQLESYFPECDEIDAFGLFDPNKIPDKSIDSALYQSWGNDRFAILESKYSQNENPDIDTTAARLEWGKLKTTMFEAYRGTTLRKFLQDLAFNNTLKDLFPQLSRLASIVLIIPVSTAECERCFSSINQIKTDLRNRLNTSTLCQIMRTVLEGGELENFDFVKAAEIWSEMRHRRISI